MTARQLTAGLPGPGGMQIRLARPSDTQAVTRLLRLAGVEPANCGTVAEAWR
jgi:hypothetical protein